MMGALPVAISTIMVSPTARPRPIITAEKMPGCGSDHDAAQGLPRGGAQRQGAPGQVLGHREDGVFGDGEDGGITAKPMAMPTTRELRWSNLMPMSWVSQMRESPCMKAFSGRWGSRRRPPADEQQHRNEQDGVPAFRQPGAATPGR